MAEKPTPFTVSDRRKFTLDGELRDESTVISQEPVTEVRSAPAPAPTPAVEAEKPQPSAGPRLVTMPAPAAAAEPEPEPEPIPLDDAEMAPAPTAEEVRAHRAAYQQASENLNLALRAANPGMDPATIAPVTFDHLVQSLYLSAVMALGAGTEPGQKPRVDILAARQNIDMLAALYDKTTGNLNAHEQRLVESALVELQTMFAEITRAIAQQQAPKPPQGLK